MSRTAPISAKKRKLEDGTRGKTAKPKRRFKKQKHYHSSSEDDGDDDDENDDEEDQVDADFKAVNLADSEDDESAQAKQKPSKSKKVDAAPAEKRQKKSKTTTKTKIAADSATSSDGSASEDDHEGEASTDPAHGVTVRDAPSDADSDSDNGSTTPSAHKVKSKRNDPAAFSTSISRILSTKLSTAQRADPVLSRSTVASATATDLNSSRLEARARTRLRAERALAKQKGRTTDVLGIERGIAGEVAEKEKQLRKIATRGVVQLFNAFRAAHERAEEARREERRKGTVGMGERERKVGEVSKEGFLELIGGKKKVAEA